MDNLEWLALHGVRHQQVVGEVAAQIAIVPARFGTIFSGEPALVKDVLGRKSALNKVFTRVTGGDEWGVKVFAEHAAPAVAAVEARSGKEYLQQKAARMKKSPERNDQELRELASALEKIATDSAPSGKVSGAQPSLLWQATFLVPRTKRKQWDQALAASDRAFARVYGPRQFTLWRVRVDILLGKGDQAAARDAVTKAIAAAEAMPEGQRSEATIASFKKRLAAMDTPPAAH